MKNNMRKSINKYLPKEDELQPVQGLIPSELFDEVKEIIKEEKEKNGRKLNWNKVLTACLTQFRDEMKGLKKS